MQVNLFSQYDYVSRRLYTHMNVHLGKRKWAFCLWRQPSPLFYRLGKYIRHNVRPISPHWPVWVHRARADAICMMARGQ